ncbi:MAG TPA: HWE histidine kinase domain-containing protein [Aquamicrobium sp.]|nr:HWE histidine kinase domain-containing protein [Aquamicrobium sp.]
MLRALRNTGIIVIYQTRDMRVLWGQNVPAHWSGGDILGKTDAEFLSGPMAARIAEMKLTVLESGQPEKLEFHDGVEGGGRWYDMWIDADTDEDDQIAGIVTTMVEVSDRKRREQTLRALLREVSHRSKNLLAIIQSIATQTGRNASGVDSFLDRFRGRLHSLASSQDLVTSSNWRGAMLSALVEGQVARYRGEGDEGVRFEGVDVHLNPNAALHIGLALHELVVNSMSHGALAHPGGQVLLSARLQRGENGDHPGLVLTWSEPTGRSGLPERKDFASVALERVVPASLDGSARFDVSDEHLDYRLEVPAANFETA